MRIEVKVLIVTMILLLSLGPMIFFFGSTPEIDVPSNNGDDQPVVFTLSGNITGKIMNIEPFISYVGTSLSNDEGYVKSILDSISDNYTISTTLNPYGQGYRYEVTIFLKNITDAKEVGFRLYFRLSPFFTDINIPTTFGELLLPTNFNIGGNVIFAKEDTRILVALLYAQDVDTWTTAYCPDIITSRNYNLTRVTQVCLDLTQGHRYGLSLTDLAAYSEEEAREMDLIIDEISSVNFNGYFSGNMTTETIQASLPEGASAVTLASLENTTVFVFLNRTDSQTISDTRSALESLGIIITEESKTGLIDFPDTMTLSGQQYELFRYDKVSIEMEINEEPGTIHARVIFTKLFYEIENIEVEILT